MSKKEESKTEQTLISRHKHLPVSEQRMWWFCPDAYLELCQTSKMELSAKIVNGLSH